MKNGLSFSSVKFSFFVSILLGVVFYFLDDFISKKVPESSGYIFFVLGPLVFYFIFNQMNSYITNQLTLLNSNIDSLKQMDFNAITLPDKKDGFRYTNSKVVELTKHIQSIIEMKNKAINENQNKSDYIAHMSREIRIPLDGIIGIVQLLCMTDINKIQFNYLETIKASGDHLLSLIKDILSYSKLKSEPIKPEFKAFYLHKAVNRSVDLFLTQAKEKQLYLKAHIEKNVPEVVMGDISKIRQVLFNMISNAIKFTNSGGVEISLNTELNHSILILQFCVKDTGIGISETKQKTLFISKDDTDVYHGMGLKLTKQIIEQMAGKIEVISKENEGSEFKFSIKSKLPLPREIEILKENDLLYNGN